MKRFVDQIGVRDRGLAYTIAAALEKDEHFSVELYEDNSDPRIKGRDGCGCYIELKIFHEEDLQPLPVGFSGEDGSDAEV
jgi:hypothetical protein